MKRKVFAGSAVAAALLFQLTAVGFPAYAAEDVSNLAGNYVKLIFEVKDSGDNTYETAVLIDNISLSK